MSSKVGTKFWGSNLRYDIPASIVVFLVALPLCLGIALTSGVPLFSGLMTGIIGGLVVGLLSGSELSVSGPAAGLTVIVSAGIVRLHNFENFLLSVVLAGFIQVIFALFRCGFLAALFPNSVIQGMLTAIGLTIILKQFPHAMGGFGHFENESGFWEWFGQNNTPHELLDAFLSLKLSAVGISLVAILVLILWESRWIKGRAFLGKIPGPLVAVVLAVVTNQIFHAGFPNLALHAGDGHLVVLPKLNHYSELLGQMISPNFAAVKSSEVWVVAFTTAAVASIETLLSVESVDKIDPLKRVSNTNRELFAQGIGNMLCGLVGGIPLTSVVVRSSANIYAGGQTRVSTIAHGVLLLFSLLFLSSILNLIPLAALASILILVGYKLSKPQIFREMYAKGPDQFLPFLITVVAILFTDLLKGIFIGLLVGSFFVIKASFYSAIRVVRDGEDVYFRFTKDLTFIHKVTLRKELLGIESGSRVYFDGSRAIYIDRDAYEMIRDFSETAKARDIQVELRDIRIKSVPKFWRKLIGM